jgi:hypothetical protein
VPYQVSGRKQYDREHLKLLKHGDTVRVAFDLDRGNVIDFVVQLECWIEGRWRPVARYDLAHDQAHRDTLDWDGRVVAKDWLSADLTNNQAMAFGERDLVKNAESFRAQFIRRKP